MQLLLDGRVELYHGDDDGPAFLSRINGDRELRVVSLQPGDELNMRHKASCEHLRPVGGMCPCRKVMLVGKDRASVTQAAREQNGKGTKPCGGICRDRD